MCIHQQHRPLQGADRWQGPLFCSRLAAWKGDMIVHFLQIWILAVCSCLLLVRGSAGVCAVYMKKEWVWL